MDMANAFTQLNWLAIALAALSAFMVGGLWYGPLFGKAWMAEFNFTEEHLAQRNQTKIFTGAFFLNLLIAFNLAMFLGPEADAIFGLTAGFFTGFGFIAAMTGVYYLFEEKSFKLLLINGGFAIVSLVVVGIILGAMN